MLLLKRHLVELVRAGKKRQTIRLWTRALLRPGQISFTPGLGKMLITHIDRLDSLHDLTDADAKADGFPNLKALLAEIRRIYGPTVPPGRSVYRIQFNWPLDPQPPALPPAPSATPAKKTTRRTPTKSAPRPRQSLMTPPQRQALRALLAKPPAQK